MKILKKIFLFLFFMMKSSRVERDEYYIIYIYIYIYICEMFEMLLKEVSSVHQDCIYTVKTEIL